MENTAIDANDPLSTPSEAIDISYPKLPPANYEMTIVEATKVANKKGTGDNLVLKWKTSREQTSTKGDILNPGQVVIPSYVSLAVSGARTTKQIAQDLTRIIRGAGLPGSTTPRELIDNPTVLAGKTLLVKVGLRQETAEFPESNEVKGVVLEG